MADVTIEDDKCKNGSLMFDLSKYRDINCSNITNENHSKILLVLAFSVVQNIN